MSQAQRKIPRVGSLSRTEIELLREKIIELVTNDPRKAAIVLTQWLGAKKPSK